MTKTKIAKVKLTEKYDYKYTGYYKQNYDESIYGFEGFYCHELGYVMVDVTQDTNNNPYLQLSVIKKGIKHNRNYKCSSQPTQRMASKKAKEFIEQVHKEY